MTTRVAAKVGLPTDLHLAIWLANRSSRSHLRRPTFALRAAVGNLRLRERRLMDQIVTSWNRLTDWLRLIAALRCQNNE